MPDECIEAKRNELGRAWFDPKSPLHLPKLKELGDGYKKEMVEALDERDKKLKELGLRLEK